MSPLMRRAVCPGSPALAPYCHPKPCETRHGIVSCRDALSRVPQCGYESLDHVSTTQLVEDPWRGIERRGAGDLWSRSAPWVMRAFFWWRISSHCFFAALVSDTTFK